MRRKCHSCLCWTCLNICCDRKKCECKIESCEKYNGFDQLVVFKPTPQFLYKAAPRKSLNDYGITKDRYDELRQIARSEKYNHIVCEITHKTNKDIAEYLLLSILKGKTYENVEYAEEFGRIPCGRTDFYGYRRLFYHFLDEKIKEIEGGK